MNRAPAETTEICAVWHGDAARHSLLAGHQRNLEAQSVAVERIYVFDAGDQPPPELANCSVTVGASIALYEAWNVALSLVRTPFVLNLNLDDRLAPDAIEKLAEAVRGGADLACGDWRICYSQEETDVVVACHPRADLPFVSGWPLPRNTVSRLGSGSERDTYGPSCLWRLALHSELPRYPWRFDDRTPIRSLGDWLFWRELAKRKKRIAAIPSVIGNYHSHPNEQAEFRLLGQDDMKRGIEQISLP